MNGCFWKKKSSPLIRLDWLCLQDIFCDGFPNALLQACACHEHWTIIYGSNPAAGQLPKILHYVLPAQCALFMLSEGSIILKCVCSIATIFVLCIKHQVTDLACTAQSKYYATFVGILKIDISFFWQVSLFTLILLLQMRICHPFEQISFDANLSFDCCKM